MAFFLLLVSGSSTDYSVYRLSLIHTSGHHLKPTFPFRLDFFFTFPDLCQLTGMYFLPPLARIPLPPYVLKYHCLIVMYSPTYVL